MVATDSKWIPSYDITNPSTKFTNIIEKLKSIHLEANFGDVRTSTSSVEKSPDVVELRTGFCEYVQSKSGKQHMDIVFDIEMEDNPNPSNHSVASELAIVLDVSGSMSGDPLEQSKQAIIKVIDKLKEDDILHFITYSDTSTIEFCGKMNAKNKIQAKNKVLNTKTRATTNIVAGMFSAVESMFTKNEIVFDSENVRPNSRRMFVFTDGVINCGVTDEYEIGDIVGTIQTNFGINTTSFGFGSDFDESLMRTVASKGKGDYFYIDGVEDIDFKVNKGLEVLQSLFAINANLNFFSMGSKDLNVSIQNVHGYNSPTGTTGQASLGDLCFDDLRQVLCTVELDCKEGALTVTEPSEIITYILSYVIVESDGSYTEKQIEGCIKVKFTDDESLLNNIPDSLKVAKAIQQVNVIGKRVLELVQQESYESAIKLKNESIDILNEIVDIDKTGVVTHLISNAKNTIEKLKQPKYEELEKDVGYSNYSCSIVHRKCF